MICHSGNAHFGDLFWTILTMSKLPGKHTLHCNPYYHEELRGLVEGLPITISGMDNVPNGSLNCWIASGQMAGIDYWNDIDIMGFVMLYFNAMTSNAGFGPVFKSREDFLCDFPAIKKRHIPNNTFDILVINADPKSGQCPRYSSSEMDMLVARLREKNSVNPVDGYGLKLADIGELSMQCRLIVGCATGPIWPTFNIWNKHVPRVILLDPMRLDYGPSVPIEHAVDAAQAGEILERMGWL